MSRTFYYLAIALATGCLPLSLHGLTVLPQNHSQQARAADATATAELVLSQGRWIDARIQTRFVFRTVEVLRGTIPSYFEVYAAGGSYNGKVNANSRLPQLRVGAQYLLQLQVVAGRLQFFDSAAGVHPLDAVDLDTVRASCAGLSAGADLSSFATQPLSLQFAVTDSGLLDSNGFRRYTAPDRNQPIPVYADLSTRPAGISEAAAITALQNALASWQASSSLLFEWVGTEVFTQSAEDYANDEGSVIRVQFHDNFNRISDSGSTLGFGGASYWIDPGNGGSLDGTPFNPMGNGYVVLNHPQAFLETPSQLEQVLTHEIGHVIGLAHSSEDPSEADSGLAEAMMYYQAHRDDRGATLNDYDILTVRKAYPLNTPPSGYDRILYAVTHPSGTSLSHPQVNQVTLRGFDRQGDPLNLQVDLSTTNNGTFSLDATTLSYAAAGYYSTASVADLAGGGYYDRLQARFSDGTHLSPTFTVRIVGFRPDAWPYNAPDGIPDAWMGSYFGSANGSTASADPDGDGYDNLSEYLLGTDPSDAGSAFKLTQLGAQTLEWTAQPYALYELETSTDLQVWQSAQLLSHGSTATMQSTTVPLAEGQPARFYRVRRVP
jgi:hypothetical protein